MNRSSSKPRSSSGLCACSPAVHESHHAGLNVDVSFSLTTSLTSSEVSGWTAATMCPFCQFPAPSTVIFGASSLSHPHHCLQTCCVQDKANSTAYRSHRPDDVRNFAYDGVLTLIPSGSTAVLSFFPIIILNHPRIFLSDSKFNTSMGSKRND